MKSRVGERGQVTIPKTLRDRLGIAPGNEVEFENFEEGLILRKLTPEDPLEALRGLVSESIDVEAYLTDSRGPAWTSELDGEE